MWAAVDGGVVVREEGKRGGEITCKGAQPLSEKWFDTGRRASKTSAWLEGSKGPRTEQVEERVTVVSWRRA